MIEESETTQVEGVDLTGIPSELHEYLVDLVDRMKPDDIEAVIGPARRVMVNFDGSVIVKFATEVKGKKKDEKSFRVRLRAIKARDYIDGTTRGLVDAEDFGSSIAFGASLSDDPVAVSELDLADTNAIFFAVYVLRKNWSSPKR